MWLRTGILGTLPSVRVEVRGRVRLSACPAYRRARDHESRRPLRIRQSLKKSEMNNLVEGISERSENDNNTKKTIWSGYRWAFLREGTYWLSIAEHNASKRPIVYEELKTKLITFLDSGLKRYPPPHYKRVVRDRSVAGYLCHLYAYCLHSAQHHLVYRGWAGGKWPRPTPDTKAKTKKVQGSDIIS